MSKRKKRDAKPNAAGLDDPKPGGGDVDPSSPDHQPAPRANPPKRNLALLIASGLMLLSWLLFLLVTALTH